MLFELSIIPLGSSTHLSGEIAEVLKIVDDSGLPYQLTPAGTCVEGGWDDVMGLIKRCHEHIRRRFPHVITTIKIEDEEGGQDKLTMNVQAVEEKAGRKLRRGA